MIVLWISVRKQVPEEGKEVLTFSHENGHTFYDLAFREADTWIASFTPRTLSHVKYWMPLPEPPKARKR
jgi:hypothetical protein